MAKKLTHQDLIAKGLIEHGAIELQSNTGKFRKFSRMNNAGDTITNSFYFVGKGGALRAGKRITDSISLTGSKFHQRMLEIGQLVTERGS